MTHTNIRTTVTASLIALGLGLGGGYLLWNTGADSATAPAKSTSKKDEKVIDYWVAPMDANYRRDGPGKSPMGMDLIPVYKGDGGNDDGASAPGFRINPALVANLGVKTSVAERRSFAPQLKATAQASYDPRLVSRVHIRSEGWVEKLAVKAVGDFVEKGDLLFTYYAPEIASAIADYQQIEARPVSGMLKGAASRLSALGVSPSTLAAVLKTGNAHSPVPVYAPRDGIVTRLSLRAGSQISKNTITFEITDTSRMWVIADIFTSQTDLITKGQEAILSDGSTATVNYIYPAVDPKLQTLRVRFIVPNPDGQIKDGQFMALTTQAPTQTALMVPDTAVIRLGDSNHVIIAHSDSRFEAAQVSIGQSSGGQTVIKSGLNAGEKIVTSGQFMLDSESSFSGAKLRMSAPTSHNDSENSNESHEDGDSGDSETPVFAVGTINSIDTQSQRVNISHPAIPDLDWPPMTMTMKVVDSIDLKVLKQSNTLPLKVHFGLKKAASGGYVITVIHTMDQMGGMQ